MIDINGRMVLGLFLLTVIVLIVFLGPLVLPDPNAIDTIHRLSAPSALNLFGTDNFGRSVLSRTVRGGQVSLMVGIFAAVLALAAGLVIGLVAGYIRSVDGFIMRIMDSVMAIPSILLAISLVAVTGASVTTVIMAITVPEIPRVVRLVRSVVLTVRELPFVEAAISSGSPTLLIMRRHILPFTIGPMVVQGTYTAASAILTESGLSFLGIGTPATVPTWGNMIADGRTYFTNAPWIIVFPGLGVFLAIMAINIFGDGMRDWLDPRLRRAAKSVTL